MSFGPIYESSILKENSLNCYQSTLPPEENIESGSVIKVFDAVIDAEDGTVVEKQSSTEAAKEDRNFNIKELLKKYKKKPEEVLQELKINFSDKQKEELSKLITDKKKLESFLKIAQNDKLSADDIFAAVNKMKEFKPSNWWTRTKNSVKTLFKEGVSEFFEAAKSETVYFASKLGENMGEIREERKDFSSENTANIAQTITEKPKVKENVMHFVKKNNDDGQKLYTEENVIEAAGFIASHVKDADKFTANAVELESIKDKYGKSKYKGTTTINYSKRVTLNSEIKPAAYAAACKSDMTDEYLDNTTENLFKNPYMAKSIEYTSSAKNADGSDRFTASDVNSTSNHLVIRNKNYCGSYADNIKELAQNQNLSSTNVLNIAKNITAHPEIKAAVMEKIQSGNYTGSEIEQYSAQYAKEASKNSTSATTAPTASYSTEAGSKDSSNTTNPVTTVSKVKGAVNSRQTASTVSSVDNEETYVQKTVISGKAYERRKVYQTLYKKYGPLAEKILQNLEKNSDFIEIIKLYGANKELLNAAIEQPGILRKLKSVSNLSKNELAEALAQCTNSSSTEVMVQALSTTKNAQKAIEITKKSKIFNLNDNALDILTSCKDTTSKQTELDTLYNGGKNKNYEI